LSKKVRPCTYNDVFGCSSEKNSDIWDCLVCICSNMEGFTHTLAYRLDEGVVLPFPVARMILTDVALFDSTVVSLMRWLKAQKPEKFEEWKKRRETSMTAERKEREEQMKTILSHITGKGKRELYTA